jgi:predicted dehydrogenase
MERFRVGMIGFGVGKLHAAALRSAGLCYRGFPPIDLVAIATATEASGQREPGCGMPVSQWAMPRYSSRLKPI